MERFSPILAGLVGRCPACGKGKLYKSYLTLVETCSNCSARLSHADTEDAPVTFMLVLVGGIGMLAVMISIIRYSLPAWLTLVICVPLVAVLSIVVLPPCKGILVALQHRYGAGEHSARPSEDGAGQERSEE
jgi:uncharacterized protein (DUF983 family)